MFKNYFKIAWRNLLRTKVYSFINISGLSIGLACCMLILLFTKDEVSYDRFHENVNNIYRVTFTELDPEGKLQNAGGVTGMMPGPAFKREIPEVKEFVRIQGEQLPVKIGTTIFDQEAFYADENFFSVFTFPFLSGNKNTALKDVNSVVLNAEVAKKFFGTEQAVGKVLELPFGKDKSFESFVVSGVVPKSPQNSSIKIQVVLPMKLNQRDGGGDQQWMNFFLNTFVVLTPNANIKAVEAKMKRVYEENAKADIKEAREKYDYKNTAIYGLQPMLDMHLNKIYSASNGLSDASDPFRSKILIGIALFILLIACINFVNLTVARSLKRAKEIGIRKVVGGARKQLIVQFLGESFLLGFFSFLLAIALVFALLPLFNSLTNKALSFSYLLDAKLIIAYISLFIITSLLAGFYPALVLSGFNPVQTLYSRMPLSMGKNYLSKGLVVLQFTLATILIISTLTMYNQYEYMSNYDLGYNDKNLVVVDMNAMKAGKLNVLKAELKKDPSIIDVAARQRGFWGTIAKVDGNQMEFTLDVIEPSYLPLLKIPIVNGRNFSDAYPSDSTQSVLVNEAFVKKAGWHDIKNKQVDFFYDSVKYDVIGVVKDYHYGSLLEEIKPQLFSMNKKYEYGMVLMKIDPKHTSAALKHIEKTVKAQQPFLPYKYDFKDLSNEQQYAEDKKAKQMIAFSTILTIFISCIGLFGLASLAAEKRTKEIGIRKVLGASVAGITRMLSFSFIKLVFIAAAIAFPVAWWAMHGWLQHYPYRISMGAWVFVIATLVVSMIALCTVSFQSIKAAVANPVKNLRSE